MGGKANDKSRKKAANENQGIKGSNIIIHSPNMKVNITTGLLPSYMKLSIMTSLITAIHHAHDYSDTLTIYCSDGAAAGSSPEPDQDPELIVETSGVREVRWCCLEGSPSGASGGWDLSIGAAVVATRGAQRGFTVRGLMVPCEVVGGTEVGGTGAEV